MTIRPTTSPVRRRLLAGVAALALVVSACGGDDEESGADTATAPAETASEPAETATASEPEETATASEPAETATASEPAETATASEPVETAPPSTIGTAVDLLDADGDGAVTIGIAAAGPANDGAYYQAVVDAAKQISADQGFNEPIVFDNIQAADAATAMADLAQQGVDVIIVGASEIAEPLPQLVADYPDIFWYCNCGAGFPEDPGLAQSTDDGGEISLTAGYATGLKLQESGGDSVTFIGCCDLGFEKQAFLAFEYGLQLIDPAFTATYVPTGDFPFDFDNTANATAALQTAVDGGADAVYPYLGGAHRPVVQAANEAGIITMSAGSSTVCTDAELDYDIAVRFDGGDYVRAVMEEIVTGEFTEGTVKQFKVGVDPEPGAVICDATADEQAAMDDIYTRVAGGEFAADLGAIAGEAFAAG